MSLLSLAFSSSVFGQSPTLAVDVNSSRHPINPNVYGIVSYGLATTLAQEIKVPNIRWGGDGTTRYNWQVDSSNAGFDWYFMGGDGNANPVPSAGPDAMVRAYAPAGALITIPIIPYVNSTSAWTCSFPTSIYGAQQATNPYVHPSGEDCGIGGVVVSVFAVLGDLLKPESVGAVFAAAPTIALPTLVLTMHRHGSGYLAVEGRSMLAGAIAFFVYASVVSLC